MPLADSAANVETLRRAIRASGLSARRFAVEVLNVNERTVRNWLEGRRELRGAALALVRSLAVSPHSGGDEMQAKQAGAE